MAASITPQIVRNMTANISELFHAGMGNDEYHVSQEMNNAASSGFGHWPVAATAATMFLTAYVVKGLIASKASEPTGLPMMGTGSMADRFKQFAAGGGWEHYVEGYNKFKDSIFRVAVAPDAEHIVLPYKYLPELIRLPDNVVSYEDMLQDKLQTRHTLGTGTDAAEAETEAPLSAIKVLIRTTLTPSLPRFTTLLIEAVKDGMFRDLPTSNEWTETHMYPRINRLVARMSGRIFVGPDICHDETYLKNATSFSIEMSKSAAVTAALPAFLRPILAPYLPQVRRWRRDIEEVTNLLRPAAKERIRAMAEQGSDFEKPDDVLQCVLDSLKLTPEDGREGEDAVAMMQIGANTAAIDSPSVNTTNAIYTLAAMPELIPMLREEAQSAIDATGGEFTNESLQKMLKLDSFLKEVLRCFPIKASTFQRKVHRSFVLSNGQVIPAGSFIEVPWSGIKDDANLYPEPENFDALRFYNLRKAEGTVGGTGESDIVSSYRLVSTSPTSLSWGYGRHSCPGRYLAANEMKIVIASLVLNYELRMPDGIEGRHPNVKVQSEQAPNPRKTIMIRKL